MSPLLPPDAGPLRENHALPFYPSASHTPGRGLRVPALLPSRTVPAPPVVPDWDAPVIALLQPGRPRVCACPLSLYGKRVHGASLAHSCRVSPSSAYLASDWQPSARRHLAARAGLAPPAAPGAGRALRG